MSAPTFTAYAVGKILDLFFGATAATPPATWYVKLTSGGTELTGNGYARLAVANNTTNWANTVSRLKRLQVLAQFAAATGPWLNVDGFAISDAATAGNDWISGDTEDLPVDCLADTTGTLNAAAHGFANATIVRVEPLNGQSLPTGLATATSYCVVNATTNTFQLSASQGGSPIAFSTYGVLLASAWYGKTGISTGDIFQLPINALGIRIPTASLG